ncbi:GNAT family N-acetyltransferase [Lacticaseibacillus camelliae]|uniref:GNAT family acetyltransferase n=1 Tax=Lacticaseibacillus camelliae DSM 22697 = JCM 13995 TaxID=1423730 RepID=A0A0R2FGG8_9LACO|nr:GNAT family N-acetyltransferase [Lacticaseibacillus camelliae]KRN23556.1 GNAT family acetyltransferase [Lacticaseibacillus camelliae DSM 22697 = JCM 13995]
MSLIFQLARPADLPGIMRIEHAGFTPAEAATETSMAARIAAYPETFITGWQGGRLVGYVVGPAITQRHLTDDLFETAHPNSPSAPYLAILSLAVAPTVRGQGIGSALLAQLAAVGRRQHRVGVTLTCLAALVPFYQRNGFVSDGQSASVHAGEVWYDMVQLL